MLCHWLILAAVFGQTTQPAARGPATQPSLRPADVPRNSPRLSVAPPAEPAGAPGAANNLRGLLSDLNRVTTRPAGAAPIVVATQPAQVLPPGSVPRLEVAQGPRTTQPAELAATTLPPLTGKRIEYQIAPDGSILLDADPRDIEAIQQLIEQLQTAVEPPLEVRIFTLKGGVRADDLASRLTQFWNAARAPAGRQLAPQDKVTITAEPRSNSILVAANARNLAEIAQIVEQIDIPPQPVGIERIELKHIRADEAKQKLDQLLQDWRQRNQQRSAQMATVTPDPRTNALLVSGPQNEIAQIRELVEVIDVEPSLEPARAVKLAIFPLEKAVARDLAGVLTDMLNAGTQQSAAAQEQIRRLALTIRGKTGERELPPLDLEKPIKVLFDTGTNAVIVASVEQNLPAIGELVKLLDTLPIAEEMMVKIYPLEFADAETLLNSLNNMFTQGRQLAAIPNRSAIAPRVPQNLPGEALAFNVGLSVDRRTNALIVAGRPEQILLVEQVIKAVDIKEDIYKFPPRIVRLEHTDVTRIATALQRIVDSRQQALQAGGAATAARERIILVPDPRTNSLIVVAADENYEEMAKLARELDGISADYLGQIHIIKLENLSATELADRLRQLWEGRSRLRREGELQADMPVIVTDTRSNSLVIASNKDDFEIISGLVKELEQQKLSPVAEIRPVVIKNNDPQRLADMLRQLFQERQRMSVPQGGQERPEDRVAIMADPLTKTLLVASSKANYDEIVRLIAQLDVQPSAAGTIRTFFIRNADVSKAAQQLQNLFDRGIYRGAASTRDLPESMTRVTIVPDVRSSAIIVSASPENIAVVEDFLKQIDRADAPESPANVRIFNVQNADAVRVADLLDQAFQGMSRAMGDSADQLQAQITPNIRNNTIMVAGSRLALQRAAELLPGLDVPPTGTTSEVRVYPLRSASATRLAPIMTELFEKRATQEQTGKVTPITILPDETSNSLIITAPRDMQGMVTELVERLDVQSPFAQQIQIIPLRAARAEQLADTLTDLVQQQQQAAGGARVPAGFAITPEPRTNSLIVFAPTDMMGNIRTIVDRLDTTQGAEERALRIFQLRNARAEDLSELLEQFFQAAGVGDARQARQLIINFTPVDPATGRPMIDPQSGAELVQRLVHQDVTVSPDPNTNSLLVMAPSGSIDMMRMLIEMLDSVQPTTVEVQVFPLINADATEMQELLEKLFQPTGGSGNERRQLVLAGENAAAAQQPTGGSPTAEVSFAVDERTNSLIAAGNAAQLRIVERLVVQLDYKEIEERMVRVVRLRNAKADEVAETLQSYFESEEQALQQAAESEAAPRQLQRRVTIQDGGENSNMLLLSYSPRMESQVISMINELDQPPPQVMIQVLMAEVTIDDTFAMGMEFALQDLLFSEKAVTGRNGTLQGPNFDTVFGTDIGAAGTGGGVSFTVSGEDFNFLFRALQTEGRLEVLSRPSIMVRDSHEANITVGTRVPTVQDVVVSSAGVVTPSVTYEEVGVILTVTPIINPDGFVNLDLEPEISDIGTSSVTVASGVTLPTFTQRKAQTSVTVKDGETIIIGGLITSRETESENKVPILGDIPLAGNAFRATTKTGNKTELLIVLTPHVIRDPAQARAVSLEMRDQTGLNDNIRRSPLMQGLQVRPEDDQLGPIGPTAPTTGPDRLEEQGPELEEFGPPISSIGGAEQATMTVTTSQ